MTDRFALAYAESLWALARRSSARRTRPRDRAIEGECPLDLRRSVRTTRVLDRLFSAQESSQRFRV